MDKQRHISDLSGEELASIGQKAVRNARSRAFAQGLSVYWDRKGLRVREHPDGRTEILEHSDER